MRGDTSRQWNRLGSSSLGLLLTAISLPAIAECDDRLTALEAALVSSHSDWTELDAAGRQLVHESGRLHGAALSIGLNCSDSDFLALISQLDGPRRYDGQTSTGAPILSNSDVRQRRAYLQANFHLAATWKLGGRLASNTIWRDMASAGAASGYPERYDWTAISLGVQWEKVFDRNRLKLAAWVGRPVRSSMELTLPGRDQATLNLGAMRQTEFAIGWHTPLGLHWYLEADVQYHRTAIDQGESSVIQRGGVPVGVAYQPITVMVDVPVAIRIGYEF